MAINSSFAEAELSLNFPQEATLNTEFKVSLISQSNKLSDVKIFIHNSSDEKVLRSEIISQILNSLSTHWQDSWLYVNSAFPSQKEFTLKLDSYSNNAKICAQLRETNKTAVYEKVCEQITIKNSDNFQSTEETIENSQINENHESSEPLENNVQETSIQQESITQKNINFPMNKITNANSIESINLNNQLQDSPIKLSPQSKSKTLLQSKDYKLEKGIIYSAFILLAIVLLIIFVKR